MKPDVQYLLECYTGEKFLTDFENVERSSESEEYAFNFFQNQSGLQGQLPRVVLQGGVHARIHGLQGQLPRAVAQGGIYGPLNIHQRQQIREISRNLKSLADSIEIRPSRDLVYGEQVLQNDNLDESERQVVNNIYSIRNVATVSTVAEYLENKLTSRTMRAALHFLCDSVSSVPEELAIVCELVKLTAPKIRKLARSTSINEVIEEFVEERLPRMK